MTKTDDKLGFQLDNLAEGIVEEANSPDTPFDAKLDAFKVVSTYWLGRTKINAKQPEESEGTFDDLTKRIASTSSVSGH